MLWSQKDTAQIINLIAKACHAEYRTWWVDINIPCKQHEGDHCPHCWGTGFEPKDRNVGEMLMLCVSELAEAMEGHRKGLMDDKLPHRRMIEVELADLIIRVFDLGDALNLDLGGAYVEKMAYNLTRKDHKIEARQQDGGKKY